MASISTTANGQRTIQFTGKDKRRRSIRLGKMPLRNVEAIKIRVEQLNSAAISGNAVETDCARWLAERDTGLLEKLAAVGLIPKQQVSTLATFLDAYIEGRTDLTSRTRNNLKQSRKFLVEFLGEKKPLREITAGDADECRRWMMTKVGENTARRHCGRAKQFFRAATRKQLITTNPFADMKGTTVKANRERDYFISREDAGKVIEACPNVQWKLLFALARFGGLRCPSEHLALTWDDIDWEHSRITVRSPKTEHHEGHESRLVPIFPELYPLLLEASEQAKEKTVHVITLCRDTNTNLRTHLERIITKAGVAVWPKLFQNLRATRATELAAAYPGHVAAAWLGHSTLVAQKHYWRVTDADFDRAATEVVATAETRAAKSGASDARMLVQNQDSHTIARDRTAPKNAAQKAVTAGLPSKNAANCAVFEMESVPPRGFEGVDASADCTSQLSKPASSRAAKSGATAAPNHPSEPHLKPAVEPLAADLDELAAAWPALPEEARAAILAIARGSHSPR